MNCRRKTFGRMMALLITVILVMGSHLAAYAEQSDDNSLSSLGIQTQGVTVSPDFEYDHLNYDVVVPAGTAELSLQKIERGPIPALSKEEPALAGMVEETLLTALEPDTSQRMVSVRDLADPVIAYLGDPQEGRESLRDLLDQSDPDDEDDGYEEPAPSLLERAPWLPGLLQRAVPAAGAGGISPQRLLPRQARASRGAAASRAR